MDPKLLVQQGYDRMSAVHDQWSTQVRGDERDRYASFLLGRLPAHAAILELGCGSGSAATISLASRFDLTAVDISARQLEAARRKMPAASFVQADMGTLDFRPATFDAIVAFYSIIHVPREEHTDLLQRIATWLRPGGLLIATMGANSTDAGYEDDWLGVPMYWSHFDRQANRRLVERAGLQLLVAQEETVDEHGRPATFLWVIAGKGEMPQHK